MARRWRLSISPMLRITLAPAQALFVRTSPACRSMKRARLSALHAPEGSEGRDWDWRPRWAACNRKRSGAPAANNGKARAFEHFEPLMPFRSNLDSMFLGRATSSQAEYEDPLFSKVQPVQSSD